MLRRSYPQDWSLDRKLRRLNAFHAASAAAAALLAIAIFVHLGTTLGAVFSVILACGIVLQYRNDRSLIMDAEKLRITKG